MLFSYKFFTFSQFPNKFYIRKSTSTCTPAPTENPPLSTQNLPPHNTKTTKTPPPTPPQQQQQQNQRLKRERLRDWGKERSVFSGGDKISLGWWRREQDARLRSRWRRRWGRREKKKEAWPARDLGGGAVWPRRWGNTIWAGQSLAGLAKAWLRWAWRWVLDRVRSVLVFELSLFRCGSIIFFLEMVWR